MDTGELTSDYPYAVACAFQAASQDYIDGHLECDPALQLRHSTDYIDSDAHRDLVSPMERTLVGTVYMTAYKQAYDLIETSKVVGMPLIRDAVERERRKVLLKEDRGAFSVVAYIDRLRPLQVVVEAKTVLSATRIVDATYWDRVKDQEMSHAIYLLRQIAHDLWRGENS